MTDPVAPAPSATPARTPRRRIARPRRSARPLSAAPPPSPVPAVITAPEACPASGTLVSQVPALPEAAPASAAGSVAAPRLPSRASPRPGTRTAHLIALLSRPGGATLDELMQATGWQAHSVRGFLAGTLRRAGHTLGTTRTDRVRIYRIVTQQQP